VEESFPLEWSYDHAEPHGFVYRIHREPLTELSAETVRRDFEFWDGWIARLEADPRYAKDYDAQRSFSKLRATAGNLYRHRKMDAEAERAYRQALRLWQGNGEGLNAMSQMLWERGDFDGVIALFQTALEKDPNNIPLWRMFFSAENRKELQGKIEEREKALRAAPGSREDALALIELYAAVDDEEAFKDFLKRAVAGFAKDPGVMRAAALAAGSAGFLPQQLEAGRAWTEAEPEEAEAWFLLAKSAAASDDRETALQAARRAIELGGLPMREGLAKSREFERWREDGEVGEDLRIKN
jgi:tetratricopeptide (TPR) repeat protein